MNKHEVTYIEHVAPVAQLVVVASLVASLLACLLQARLASWLGQLGHRILDLAHRYVCGFGAHPEADGIAEGAEVTRQKKKRGK